MSETENMTKLEEPVQEPRKKRLFGKKEKEEKTVKQEIIEWIVTLAVAAVIALSIKALIFEPVRVDGSSMSNTLMDGEILLVTKPEYLLGDPERFDVVICHYPDRGNTNFVKRIVGIPGDTVEVKGGYLYVNGEKYEEPYIDNRPNYTMSAYTVPEGHYFVLGDNRSNSNDSHLIGPITRDMVCGHVRHVVWPISEWRAVE